MSTELREPAERFQELELASGTSASGDLLPTIAGYAQALYSAYNANTYLNERRNPLWNGGVARGGDVAVGGAVDGADGCEGEADH